MTSIQRLRAVWTVFPGGPGLSTFYFNDAHAAQSALHDLFFNVKNYLPPDVTITVQAGGDVIEDTTGTLTAVWAGTIQAPVVGTAPRTTYAAPAGGLLRWETLAIRAGSRLRGRTYLVPLTADSFGAAGTLAGSVVTDLANAASILVGAVTPNMVVWQRPRVARASYVDGRGIPHKALSGRQGSSAVVTSSSVPFETVILRSRRD